MPPPICPCRDSKTVSVWSRRAKETGVMAEDRDWIAQTALSSSLGSEKSPFTLP